MKKFVSVFFAVLLVAFTFDATAQKQSKPLPQPAQDFISKHFPGKNVVETEYNRNDNSKRHEAKLNDGTKFDFNPDGVCTEVESKSPLPDAIVPEPIRAYVQANYPGQSILKWKRDSNNQEIELSNGLDIDFDLNHKFMRVDK